MTHVASHRTALFVAMILLLAAALLMFATSDGPGMPVSLCPPSC